MTAADGFLLGVALFLALAFRFLFRHLPEERWQFVASLPLKKRHDGAWQGLNLTFYGLFTGLAGGVASPVLSCSPPPLECRY